MHRRKSSRITKYILLTIVLYAIVTVTLVQPDIQGNKEQTAALAEEIAQLEQENLELEAQIASLGTDEAVMRLARERLHWVTDAEIVYADTGE